MAGTLTVCCAETAGEGEFAGVCATCWPKATEAHTTTRAADKPIDRCHRDNALLPPQTPEITVPLVPHRAESLRLSGTHPHSSEAPLRIRRSVASPNSHPIVAGKPEAVR